MKMTRRSSLKTGATSKKPVATVAGAWAEAADAVVEVPEVPADIPMANNHGVCQTDGRR